MNQESKNNEENYWEEWVRHFDILLWTVTTVFIAGIGGLLLHIYDQESTPDTYLISFGLLLTTIAVVFAASFRHQRQKVWEKTQKSFQELMNSREPMFYQWTHFVIIFLALDLLFLIRFLGLNELTPFKIQFIIICIIAISLKLFLFFTTKHDKPATKEIDWDFRNAVFQFLFWTLMILLVIFISTSCWLRICYLKLVCLSSLKGDILMIKTLFDGLALLCTIPTAFLAFKRQFIENYKAQCADLLKEQDKNYKKNIRFDYKILASIFFGIKGDTDWLHLFDPGSEISKKIEHDKSDAVRGLIWFISFAICAIISITLQFI